MRGNIKNTADKKIYIGIIGIAVVVMLLLMPMWYIHQIEVKQNSYYTTEEIIEASGVDKLHFSDLSFKKAKERIMTLPFVTNADISYSFPGKIIIKVTENTPYAYVEFMGSYLCLNEKGQVIRQSNTKEEELPLIVGMKFKWFKLGEALPIENEEAWDYAFEMIEICKKYNYLNHIDRIDVYNLQEIHLYVGSLDVIIGDIGDFDKKLVGLIEMHEQFDIGRLDMTSFGKTGQAYLDPIT